MRVETHYAEQDELANVTAERVQTLGGVALALADDLAKESHLSPAPRGRELPAAKLQGLEQIVRSTERQRWFIGEHLVVDGA